MKAIAAPLIAATIALVGFATAADASLIGTDVTVTYIAEPPPVCTPFNCDSQTVTVVNDPVTPEISSIGIPGIDLRVNLEDSTLLIEFNAPSFMIFPLPFNGLRFENLVWSGGAGIIIDVTPTSSPSLAGAVIGFTDNEVDVNFAGLTGIAANDSLLLTLTVQHVPEPAALMQFAVGLVCLSALIGVGRRRRGRSSL